MDTKRRSPQAGGSRTGCCSPLMFHSHRTGQESQIDALVTRTIKTRHWRETRVVHSHLKGTFKLNSSTFRLVLLPVSAASPYWHRSDAAYKKLDKSGNRTRIWRAELTSRARHDGSSWWAASPRRALREERETDGKPNERRVDRWRCASLRYRQPGGDVHGERLTT